MTTSRRVFLLCMIPSLFLLPFSPARAVGYVADRPFQIPVRLAASKHEPVKRPVMMIDPGHGGKNPGAIGISGTYEKRGILAAALHLKRKLEASGRCTVRTTRDRDVFLSLQSRVSLAERQGASLFISIHANALKQHNVRGTTVYTFATKAPDEQYAALALRESKMDSIGVTSFKYMDPELQSILSSTGSARNTFRCRAVAICRCEAAVAAIRMTTHPTRSARFAVLRSVRIPSVLVEMGFMSNRTDEQLMKQSRHRNAVATAMRQSVADYFSSAQSVALFTG